jgi:hypothetical protein
MKTCRVLKGEIIVLFICDFISLSDYQNAKNAIRKIEMRTTILTSERITETHSVNSA